MPQPPWYTMNMNNTTRRRRVVEEVYYEPAPLFSSEFLAALQLIPSIANYEKPAEAKDVCWKCNGEEDVDQVSPD